MSGYQEVFAHPGVDFLGKTIRDILSIIILESLQIIPPIWVGMGGGGGWGSVGKGRIS